MESKRVWEDNAFWHSSNKDCAEAILSITDDKGRVINQVLTVRKENASGELNTDFEELLKQVGAEKIDANTEERKERKALDKETETRRRKAEEQARDLERLFDAKIKILEIEIISRTKNADLKRKLRRSKNILELNMYAQLIMMEESGIGFVTYDSENRD
jgi:hypothetical protein